MFKRRTLFILGAGASYEVGLPVGAGLADDIRDRLRVEAEEDFNRIKNPGDKVLAAHFFPTREENAYLGAYNMIRQGILFSKSIDDFLNIHSGNKAIVTVGKAAIVRAILEAEANSLLDADPYGMFDVSKIQASWLVKFMRELAPGVNVSEVRKVLENVSFIVFNYDRCLEHFLHSGLNQLYGISRPDAWRIVEAANIIHPYGSIGSLLDVPFGGRKDSRPDYGKLLSGIKTYTEQIEDQTTVERMKHAVADAQCIVFLGFAYHDQNMALLTPAQPIPGKRIYGTAYGMSGDDAQIVSHRLRDAFPSTAHHTTENLHIRIKNDLTCADLFDHYAKSLSS